MLVVPQIKRWCDPKIHKPGWKCSNEFPWEFVGSTVAWSNHGVRYTKVWPCVLLTCNGSPGSHSDCWFFRWDVTGHGSRDLGTPKFEKNAPEKNGVFPKMVGFPPKSSIFIGISIIFTIHFGVPLFLETSKWWLEDDFPFRIVYFWEATSNFQALYCLGLYHPNGAIGQCKRESRHVLELKQETLQTKIMGTEIVTPNFPPNSTGYLINLKCVWCG